MGEYLAHKIKDEIDISKIDYVVPVLIQVNQLLYQYQKY